jgi:hypothetical protein
VLPGVSPISFQSESAGFISPVDKPRASVDLRIGELLLDGFTPADRYAIGEAVERELARLLNEQGTPSTVTQEIEIEHLDGGAIELRQSTGSAEIGIELAKAVYGGLKQ